MNIARALLFVCVTLLCTFGARAFAQTATESTERAHDRAVAAYQAGRYEQARELWLAELGSEDPEALDRAALLFNLGNTAFRDKKPLQAAGWYTAALRLDPRHADAWHNLEFVRREAGLEPADRGDLTATARRLLTVMTLAESERALFAALAVLVLALAWEALRGGTAAKVVAWVSFGLVVVLAVPWTWQTLHADERAVFAAQPEGAALTSEPRADAALIGRIAAGTVLERVDLLPGWVRVRRDDGTVGWIAAETCVPLYAPFDFAAEQRAH